MNPNRDDVRLSLSEARAWDEDHRADYLPLTEGSVNQLPTPHKPGWTPAPDLAGSMRHSEPVKKPTGRDYEAILRAAKKKPVGYWEDAPRGEPFQFRKPRRVAVIYTPPAPIPDGARGDVWPRYWVPTVPHRVAAVIFVDARTSNVFWNGYPNVTGPVTHNAIPEADDKRWREVDASAFAAWLDANGHKAYADELRAEAMGLHG